jgi:hypothetical protein
VLNSANLKGLTDAQALTIFKEEGYAISQATQCICNCIVRVSRASVYIASDLLFTVG